MSLPCGHGMIRRKPTSSDLSSIVMRSNPRPLFLICLTVGILPLNQAWAQIQASLKLSKREYIAHEPVVATVTLTNNAGRDLLVHTDEQTNLNWLDFEIKNARGTSLSPLVAMNFGAVKIPAGRSIAKSVDLTGGFRVTEPGRFRCKAVIRLPGGSGNFVTNTTYFSVTLGRQVYSQRIGDPALGNVREYRLSIHNSARKSSLYVHMVDIRTGRNLQAFRMGEVITSKPPKATVDRANNLHVLFLTAPNLYAHGTVTPEGSYLGTKYYKPAQGAKPALATFNNGDVAISGGISHDPRAEAEGRARLRKLSERPRMTYR